MRRNPQKKQKENVPLNSLPETGLLRLPRVLMFIEVSKSTWWGMIRQGMAPKPIKLSKRCSAWRAEDIRAVIDGTFTPETQEGVKNQ
ncbi:helix-turn-helix transcriptional regulator [Syntrophus gentianae]|uniref:helix-turn-helix transcriptional regulator n=1 Tax=Syntrophus gentianae TaxID=43775 RepID=UPI001C31D488|nr:AlpA family phage regulatory protein [Syntrophus gentianae]